MCYSQNIHTITSVNDKKLEMPQEIIYFGLFKNDFPAYIILHFANWMLVVSLFLYKLYSTLLFYIFSMPGRGYNIESRIEKYNKLFLKI